MSVAPHCKRLAVLCSGEGTNLQAILDAIQSGRLAGVAVAVVVSDQPDARALERARTHGVPAVALDALPLRGPVDEQLLPVLRHHEVDLIALAGFMRILGLDIIAAYRHRILNIHPALLPAFPGARAVRDALEYGVTVTGVTVHLVDEGVDTGPVVLQAAVPVEPGDTEAALLERLHAVEHRLYPAAIQHLVNGTIRVVGRQVNLT